MADPYLANTVLMLHCNGANGSTTITDELGKTVTVGGNAQISTAQGKFNQSLLLDGAGDYVYADHASDFNFGTGDFTAECFFRFPSAPAGDQVLINIKDDGGYSGIRLFLETGRTVKAAAVKVSGTVLTGSSAVLATNTWHHASVSRSSGLLRCSVNGALASTASCSFALNDQTRTYVGIRSDLLASSAFNGYIDEVRITKGVDRYPGTYTVATSEFPPPQLTENGDFSIAGVAALSAVGAFDARTPMSRDMLVKFKSRTIMRIRSKTWQW